jgi:ribosomal protein S18 acetylase RimI-like enzyme
VKGYVTPQVGFEIRLPVKYLEWKDMEPTMQAEVSTADTIGTEEVLDLYRANRWSAADKPVQLMAALKESHSLVTARVAGRLVGLGYAISDGHLVVYFPHMLVHPEFHRYGLGHEMMQALLRIYAGFHQMTLIADGRAIDFYRSLGFERAGKTKPMWIYRGGDH